MANIIGTNGNDTLVGSNEADTIKGLAGNDTITSFSGNDTLIGGGGKDKFVYEYYYGSNNTDIITDFGGVDKGTNPTAAVIAEVDTLNFQGNDSFTAQNLLLTQNGNNLEINFEGDAYQTRFLGTKVILQNFALENLENLSKSTGATVNLGNILFDGQTTITDSFDVFNANSSQSTLFNLNTVTFLNDLNNNVNGFDNSDDVINGQGGDDIIDGLSGNDILRGGAGNDSLIGGVGDDALIGGVGNDSLTGNDTLVGGAGNDILNVEFSTGDNTLNGGSGNDTLRGGASSGNNLLSGGDGNDDLYTSNVYSSVSPYIYFASSSNNTLEGGAGDDTLNAQSPSGNNLLSGGDGNDSLSTSGITTYRGEPNFSSSGNNTLNGGVGNDTLNAGNSTGNNLLSGGDGNDSLSISGDLISYSGQDSYYPSSGNNTLNGGAGDDTLRVEYYTGNNLFSGGDGNDSLYLDFTILDTLTSDLVTQTVDGGKGDDLLSVDYTFATGGITTTFNPITNISLITAGTYRLSYNNIEVLNISGTIYDDFIVGSNGNDTLSAGTDGKDTIDGAKGDDVLSVDYRYSNPAGGITTTFNATTNIGSITAGTNRVDYKNIEQLNISGTSYDDLIVGNSENDTLSTGYGGKDTIDGGAGDDVLSVDYSNSTGSITTTFNATTNIGSITAGTNRVDYKNIERLNISGTYYDDLIVGNGSNDTLSGGYGKDTIIGNAGNDILTGGSDDNTLTGGAGNDKFVYNSGDGIHLITDFGAVGKGSNPSETVIASSDTLQFTGSFSSTGSLFTAQNLQLTQNGNNLEITFEGFGNDSKVILQNFKLENLDNLPATSSRPAIGNILFDGQISIVDSFDVFDPNSTQTSLFNRNTVTFLNELDNNITGFDNSNDVINGQGGDDIIDGKSGNDLLRGGAGNDILIGGVGNDTLISTTGNDILDGGTGDDRLNASGSTGDNLLSGGDGNDELDISGFFKFSGSVFPGYSYDSRSLGNNTINGGVGDDTLNASGSKGDNLLSGGNGNDTLYLIGSYSYDYGDSNDSRSEGNNTLEGGEGDDRLRAGGLTGDNLLSGGDGNDELDLSGDYYSYNSNDSNDSRSSGNNTLNGGAGNDYLNANDSTGDNLLFGGDGNDYISVFGGSGKNLLTGGNGNDSLTGGNGNDSLIGGAGTDTFVFDSYNEGVDNIYDFNATNELIQVSTYGFDGGLSTPSLNTSQFTIGTSATTSNQRFIYDNITGALYFDLDGSAGTFTQVKFAQLSGGVTLTEKNFVVI
ncbi:MAG: calcium-binding protein [Nostoc sp.]|uniref:beta strand repeat-containing protein n=1 Tax=Nostoc sp. TaxID=1180 RepID=UPI002FF889B7